MGALIRARDWEATRLGRPEHWPEALKSAIGFVLNSATAMHLSWGEDLLQFYNDAYTPVLTGGKHPAALGRSVRDSFPEIWDFVGPLFDRVLNAGEAISMENAGLMMYRDGVLAESFFSFSYSPLKSLAGDVCGVMSVVWETTEQVLVERREHGLRLLAEHLTEATTLAQVRAAVEQYVDENRADVPFLLWYERDDASTTWRLGTACGIARDAPLVDELGAQAGGSAPGRALDRTTAGASMLPLPGPANRWLTDPVPGMAVDCIAVEPLCYVNYLVPDAYMVFGVGPKRAFDGAGHPHDSICRGVERAVRRISAVELERRESLRQFEAVTGVVPSMVWMTDPQGACAFVSKRWLDFTGLTEGEALAWGWMARIHPGDHARVGDALRLAIESHGSINTLYRLRRSDGVYRWILDQGVPRFDERGQFLGMVGSSLDITERKMLEDELVVLAAEDPLTGLPNRRRFREQLVQVCEDACRDATPAALVFMDLDDFKTINDSLTHEAGDVVLLEVAARLGGVVGRAGMVSRLGGDEFAIILPGHTAAEATAMAERICAAVAQPFFVHGVEVFLTASLGIAMAPSDATDADRLLSCADLAMYEVKRSGRNGISHYVPGLRAAPASMLSLRSRMSRGLERDEFFAVFQPIASVGDDRIVGAEALLRWQPPDGDAVDPAVFIPVSEETGLIVPLCEHMMSLAFAQARKWKDQGHSLVISVNLSTRQLREPDVCRRIRALTDAHGIPPDSVQLEITETVLMERRGHAERQLLDLKDMGFRVALDDFGTGYSSLAYLKNFPIDAIKIDSSFVRGVPGDVRDVAIVRTIINMSRDLQISTVAEGVETAAELEKVAALGCDFYQGYLLARPLPGAQLAALLGGPA